MHFSRWTPYSYLLLPLVLMGIFFFGPLVQALQMSLLDYSQNLYQPQWVGLLNYQRLLSQPEFWHSLRNTTFFTLGVVPAMAMVPIVMAVLINQPLKGMAFFRVMIYLPVVVSMVVVGIAWKWLYAKDGLINLLLAQWQIPPVDWLIDPDIALLAVMLVVIWKGLAYYMMMYLAQLQTVSQELYEAARMDGASPWQVHWHVTLPHLKPTILLVMMISTIGSLKTFTEFYVMTRGGPMNATETLVYFIYKRAFEHLDLGSACAAGLVLMLLLVALSVLQIKLLGGESDDLPQPARLKAAQVPLTESGAA